MVSLLAAARCGRRLGLVGAVCTVSAPWNAAVHTVNQDAEENLWVIDPDVLPFFSGGPIRTVATLPSTHSSGLNPGL